MYCSLRCRRKTEADRSYTPSQLIELLKQAALETQRTPAKREIRTLAGQCTRAFGTWNNAIIAAGLEPNRSHDHRMYKRVLAKALDGHICDSISEATIDNWLYKNGISHERYYRYPEGNYEADWTVTTAGKIVFIEYFGLANDSPRYDRSTKKKQALCRKHGIQLIEIYPRDLYPKVKLGGNWRSCCLFPETILRVGARGFAPPISGSRSRCLRLLGYAPFRYFTQYFCLVISSRWVSTWSRSCPVLRFALVRGTTGILCPVTFTR